MKKVTKFFAVALVISILTATQTFAQQGGFEIGLSVPLGMGAYIPSKDYKDLASPSTITGRGGFEWGVALQPGWKIAFNEKAGLSILLDLAYKQDVLSGKFSYSIISTKRDYILNSFQVGLYPKFSIGNVLIGIGGGIKMVLSGSGRVEDTTVKLSGSDINDLYESNIMPYIKASADYAFYLNDKMAILAGIYAGYDFSLTEKSADSMKMGGAFDIGAQVGFKFGPR